MAIVNWPADLPDPESSAWKLNPAPLTIRSEMEAGAARVRRISAQRHDMVQVSWTFTLEQFGKFRDWYSNSIEDGAAWFDIDLYTGLSGANAGKCEVKESARFVGQWEATAVANKYIRVAAELEVR